MENTPNRVPAGITTGGQFAPVPHTEPSLTLVPPTVDGPDFDHAFEAARGAGLRKELQALAKIPVRSAITASRLPDLLRDSYGVYFADGQAARTRTEAVAALEEALCHLPRDRRAQQIELLRFAVHEEMKHWSDREYVLNAEHPYELLIDTDSYTSEDDLIENGQEENRERWEMLANTAAYYAIAADNTAAVTRTSAA